MLKLVIDAFQRYFDFVFQSGWILLPQVLVDLHLHLLRRRAAGFISVDLSQDLLLILDILLHLVLV